MLYDEEGQILAWLMSYKPDHVKYQYLNIYSIVIRKFGIVTHSSSTMYGTMLKGENFTVLAVFKLQMLYPQSFQPINNILELIYKNYECFIMNVWVLQQTVQYALYVYLIICVTISGFHWLLFLTLLS